MSAIEAYEKNIGYIFKDKEILYSALTHSSYANEHKSGVSSYERLEFLGDSILGFITSEYLFRSFPGMPEGELTKIRASLVCERSLCEFSHRLSVGKFLRLSNGEQNSGGRERASILADVFESTVAAIYLDSGDFQTVEKFILRFIGPAAKAQKKKPFKDYKTMLQEIIQQNPQETLEYVLTGESGPDHNKHFKVEVHLNNNIIGHGGGKSKKEAEQRAAREALELMGY